MKLQTLAFSLLLPSYEAFVVPMTQRTSVSLKAGEPSIEALREAAAKARQEAERLRQVSCCSSRFHTETNSLTHCINRNWDNRRHRQANNQ